MHPEASAKPDVNPYTQRGTLVRWWRKHREETSFLREYLWKYRAFVGFGIFTLIVVDVLEVIPPILLKRAVDAALEPGPARTLIQLGLAYLGVALIQGF